jgi:DNA-binding response OmpR family regulator
MVQLVVACTKKVAPNSKVLPASSGSEVLESLSWALPRLIIIDSSIGAEAQRALVYRVRSEFDAKTLPIVLTGGSRRGAEFQVFSGWAVNDWLDSPLQVNELLNTIQRLSGEWSMDTVSRLNAVSTARGTTS